MPVAAASSTARRAPRLRAATSTQAAVIGTKTAAAISQSVASARSTPSVGSPATRKTARPTVSAIAQAASERRSRRFAHHAPSGKANSSEVASNGCTSTSEASPRATAWATYPSVSAAVPMSQIGRRTRRVIRPRPSDSSSGTSEAARCCITKATANSSAATSATAIARPVTGAYSPTTGATSTAGAAPAPGGRRRTRKGGSASTISPSAMPPT